MRTAFLLLSFLFFAAYLDAQTCAPDTVVACDDGNPCTVNDSCRNGICSGTPQVCTDNDNNVCTSVICNPLTGTCITIFNNANCDDGNPCTINDRCVNGICAGTPKNCNDNNPCTTDFCDGVTGNCMHVFNTATCNDGNACTVGDVCSGGVCVSGTPRVCDDGNPCTIDACNPFGGCVFVMNNGAPCTDNNPCTNNDQCVNGNCVGTVSSGTVLSVTSKLDDGGPGTFRSIVANACENDIITFAVDTVTLASPVEITRNLTITGNGAASTVLDGNNVTRLLTIPATVNLGISNISLINGYGATDGGAFYNLGALFVKDVVLKHNFEGTLLKAYSGSGNITVLSSTSLQILQ
jgi:Dictyostelium (slime mold) repeat